MELRNPTLAAQGERPFLRADSVRLVFSRRVLWGTIEIQRLELARPRVTIVRHANGTTNLPVSRTDPSSGPTPLHLGIVELRQISIEIEDEMAGHAVSAGPIDLMLDSRSTDPRPGAFGPGAFTVRLAATAKTPAKGSALGNARWSSGIRRDEAHVPELSVETPEGRLTLSGWIDLVADALSVEAQGRLDLDLARAGRFIGASGAALAGSASAQFAVSGSLADPVVRVDVAGRDLSYRSVTGADLSAKATYTAGRLEIDTLDVTSSFGAAHASGELTLASSPGHAKARTESWRDSRTSISIRCSTSPASRFRCASARVRRASSTRRWTAQHPFEPGWLQRLAADGSAQIMPAGSGLSVAGQLRLHLDGGGWTIAHALQSTTGRAACVRRGVGTASPWRVRWD